MTRRLLVIGLLLLLASCTTAPESSFTPPQVLDLAQTIHLPRRAIAIAAAKHSIWALGNDAHRNGVLWRVPPQGPQIQGRARSLPFHASLWTVMIGSGHELWIAVGRRGRAEAMGGLLIRYDLSSSRVVSRTPIPPRPTAMTLIGRNLWIGLEGDRIGTGRILVMNASTGHLKHSMRHLSFPDIIIPGPTAVWASGVNANLWRIDPKTFTVKHLPGYHHLEAITQTSMWTLGKGVERLDPRTAILLGHSSPLGCTPARVIATNTRAWVTHCVKVGPDPVPEGPPQIVPMLFAYDISQDRLVGPPIPVGELGQSQRPFFKFGSIWWLAHGLQKVDPSALTCLTNATCAKAKEARFTRSP